MHPQSAHASRSDSAFAQREQQRKQQQQIQWQQLEQQQEEQQRQQLEQEEGEHHVQDGLQDDRVLTICIKRKQKISGLLRLLLREHQLREEAGGKLNAIHLTTALLRLSKLVCKWEQQKKQQQQEASEEPEASGPDNVGESGEEKEEEAVDGEEEEILLQERISSSHHASSSSRSTGSLRREAQVSGGMAWVDPLPHQSQLPSSTSGSSSTSSDSSSSASAASMASQRQQRHQEYLRRWQQQRRHRMFIQQESAAAELLAWLLPLIHECEEIHTLKLTRYERDLNPPESTPRYSHDPCPDRPTAPLLFLMPPPLASAAV
jgi:hypothetical protein